MDHTIQVYNSLSRKREAFVPLNEPFVGMYVCGPTVYGYPHLGHAKSYVSFDLIYRYLMAKGYKVRYVQNITDVGHLTDDADEGEDKIARQSRIEKIEPMEVVEHYMYSYFQDMDMLNVKRPSISPRPSGHIPEQIEYIEDLVNKGLAYVSEGSVYFDVKKYDENHDYGKLSGRRIEELMEGAASRKLEGQSGKRSQLDFALWKKADESHLMQWHSPWGKGYPGWHIECTVMSQKYLGEKFDIHGGGLENIFPHHECEVAQAEARKDDSFAKYWIHNNMVTVNGQKMGKSLGNGISCQELFSGDHKLLSDAYSPMTVRFFILQSHYRSTLDFSNEALQAAGKGFRKLMTSYKNLDNLTPGAKSEAIDLEEWNKRCFDAMDDDFNSPKLIANLFEICAQINSAASGNSSFDKHQIDFLNNKLEYWIEDVLGLKAEEDTDDSKLSGAMELLIDLRNEARANKNFELSDKIRDELSAIGIVIKDGKNGTEWTLE